MRSSLPGSTPSCSSASRPSDDAAVFRVSDDLAVIQTLDFFPPVVDDPYIYGQIAAANAMSDVYAMGGEVKLALNIAAFPEDLDPELLAEIVRGGADKVAEAGGVVAGGHTVIDAEPKYGLSVMGVIHPDAVLTTGGAQPGDALLLTKPLGTGILMSAAGREGAGAGFEAAVESMRALNRHSAHLARAAAAHAVTDVTGFGLAGHASEVAQQSGATLVFDLDALPLLPDAARFAAEGVVTGGGNRNVAHLGDRVRIEGEPDQALVDVFYDPQTSGGLLIAVPEADAAALSDAIAGEGGGCWRIAACRGGHAARGGPVSRAVRLLLTALAPALALAAAACFGGGDDEAAAPTATATAAATSTSTPVPTPTPVDPASVIHDSADRMEGIQRFHFTLDHENGRERDRARHHDGVRRGRLRRRGAHARGRSRGALGTVKFETAVIVLARGQLAPEPVRPLVGGRGDLDRGVLRPGRTASRRSCARSSEPTLDGREEVGGVETYRIDVLADSGDPRDLPDPPSPASRSARRSGSAWTTCCCTASMCAVRSRKTRPPDILRRLELSRFGEDVDIAAPP